MSEFGVKIVKYPVVFFLFWFLLMDLHVACFRNGAWMCKVQILCVQGRPSSSGDGLADSNSVSADGIVPCPDFTVVWK